MVVGFFKENGLLEEVKPYRHSVGHSYRSHVPIEPYLSDQWYVQGDGRRAWPGARRLRRSPWTRADRSACASRLACRAGCHASDRPQATPSRLGRPAPLHPRALRQDLPGLAREHPRLVHQPAALVGTSDSGVESRPATPSTKPSMRCDGDLKIRSVCGMNALSWRSLTKCRQCRTDSM